jgi:hypothetical protein
MEATEYTLKNLQSLIHYACAKNKKHLKDVERAYIRISDRGLFLHVEFFGSSMYNIAL